MTIVDQDVGDYFKLNLPGSVAIACTSRQALIRGVRDMARAGMRQLIDIGSGLPTADHQEIRGLFGDLEVLEPDIVPSAQWRPDVPAGDTTSVGTVGRELTVWERLIVTGPGT